MSARLRFDPAQIDSLPAILHAVHLTMAATETHAASNGYAVDWAAGLTLAARDDGSQVTIICDPKYVRLDDTPVPQYAVARGGPPDAFSPDEGEDFDTADDALAAVSSDAEAAYTRTVTAWTQVGT